MKPPTASICPSTGATFWGSVVDIVYCWKFRTIMSRKWISSISRESINPQTIIIIYWINSEKKYVWVYKYLHKYFLVTDIFLPSWIPLTYLNWEYSATTMVLLKSSNSILKLMGDARSLVKLWIISIPIQNSSLRFPNPFWYSSQVRVKLILGFSPPLLWMTLLLIWLL